MKLKLNVLIMVATVALFASCASMGSTNFPVTELSKPVNVTVVVDVVDGPHFDNQLSLIQRAVFNENKVTEPLSSFDREYMENLFVERGAQLSSDVFINPDGNVLTYSLVGKNGINRVQEVEASHLTPILEDITSDYALVFIVAPWGSRIGSNLAGAYLKVSTVLAEKSTGEVIWSWGLPEFYHSYSEKGDGLKGIGAISNKARMGKAFPILADEVFMELNERILKEYDAQ